MRIVSAVVARPLDACWRAFTEPATMPKWVPGLRKATLVDFDVEGMPHEVRFEYVAGLAYALRYTYDTDKHVVRWEPRLDEIERGGVRGFARFEDVEGGTQFTYALEHDEGRKAAERALDDPHRLVDAFTRWMHEERD
ncbi:MAG TPA: SRPBCC family protein [Kofleriaceae bacterium]|nr:SRPBCC family protein [Kofleriaceae bacterium]